MKYLLFGAALCVFFFPGPTLADASLEERVGRLEQLLGELQGRLDEQDRVIARKDQTIQRQGTVIERQADLIEGQQKQQANGPGKPNGDWLQNLELGGLVEIEANYADPYTGRNSSDLTLATVELGIGSQVNDWTRADIVLTHEEDDNDLEVDVVTVTMAPPHGSWFVTGGQFYLPFGAFETHMISDPITLEIGETRESALQVGFEKGQFNGSIYAFNGTNKKESGSKNRIDNWGANLGIAQEWHNLNVTAGVGFINDIGDSDGLQDGLSTNDVRDHVPGWTANVLAEAGNFVFIGEYLGAIEAFAADELAFMEHGAEPRAWNVETGYNFSLMGRDSTLAVAYQGTNDAFGLELPKRRLLVGWSINVFENTALSFEWAHDKDYSASDGGTGDKANTVTTQLAVEFP